MIEMRSTEENGLSETEIAGDRRKYIQSDSFFCVEKEEKVRAEKRGSFMGKQTMLLVIIQ